VLIFTFSRGWAQIAIVGGYSANVTETCEEQLNLIVDVQVEPATTQWHSLKRKASFT